MTKPGVMFYFEVRPCLKRLSTQEKGMLFDAILDYGEFGTEPELEGMVGVAWDFLRPKLDRDNDRYERQTEQRRYAVYVREAKGQGGPILSLKEWKDRLSSGEDRAVSDDIGRYPNPKQQPSNLKLQTPYPIPQTVPDGMSGGDRFVPPNADQIGQYCRELGTEMDVEAFLDYYTGNGWMVGQNKMRDWKAVVRSWSRKENRSNGKNGPERVCSSIGTSV